jgi:DNA helicase II / ATP-dependent DNA helicase PcrA
MEYQSLLKFGEEVNLIRSTIEKGESITPVISKIIYYLEAYLKTKYIGKDVWKEIQSDYEILQSIAAQFSELGDFINSIALQQFKDDDDDEGKLVLSTIHSAKGLEWNMVFVIGLVEFWFPLNRAIQQTGSDEEERRLFYVAVTRARKELFLTSYSKSLNPYGQIKDQKVSRFVKELPNEVYESIN